MSAYIHLSDKDNNNLGALRFVDESPLPKNIINEDGTFDIFYHIDRFNDIINILRYEKPLWVSIDNVKLYLNILSILQHEILI